MVQFKDSCPVIRTKEFERRVMYTTNQEGERIEVDQCFFCKNYDAELPYKKCKSAGFGYFLEDCTGFVEIEAEDIYNRSTLLKTIYGQNPI